MKCAHITVDGFKAIVCGSWDEPSKCIGCGAFAPLLCDWKVKAATDIGPAQLCDAQICAACALQVDDDKHLCPKHQAAWLFWQFRRAVDGPRAQGGA